MPPIENRLGTYNELKCCLARQLTSCWNRPQFSKHEVMALKHKR